MKAGVSFLIALAGSGAVTSYEITWSENDRLGVLLGLEAIRMLEEEGLDKIFEEAGFEWPFGSRTGVDGTSAARLISGTVDLNDQNFLSSEEIADGYILTDTTYPRSDCVLVIGVEEELH